MKTTISCLSWNINGGFGIGNGGSDIEAQTDTIAAQIARMSPDIIALQEVHHSTTGYAQSKQIAARLKFDYCVDCILHPSHLFDDTEWRLGLTVLSRYPILDYSEKRLKNPGLKKLKNGKLLVSHDKGILNVEIKLPYIIINFCNLHLLPFRLFDIAYEADQVTTVFEELSTYLQTKIAATPTIVLGDFNHENVLRKLHLGGHSRLNRVDFKESTYDDLSLDHILYTREFELINYQVYADCLLSDHRPCYASFEI